MEFYYDKIYGDLAGSYVCRVRNAFYDLFNEYGGDSSLSMDVFGHNTSDGSSSSASNSCSNPYDKMSDFDKWLTQSRSSNIRSFQKSEADQYLEEPVFPRNENFNILTWWKISSPKLPVLAKMARDVLAVPATTIASESAFSVGGGVIDETRSSLLPEIVETIVTTSDWIESRRKSSM